MYCRRLFGADDKIKPGLTFYADFAKTAARMSAPNGGKRLPEDDPDAIGLYVPRHYYASDDPARPEQNPRPALAARTLNATGQCRVTLSLQQEHLRAACGPCQEERSLTFAQI